VPFEGFFPAGVADPTLIDRLTRYSELQGVLRMAVGGLQQVMRRGQFSIPASVTNATENFKKEADPLRGFIDECIELLGDDSPFHVSRTEIYSAYTTYATRNGFHHMSAARFYEGFLAAVSGLGVGLRMATRHGVRGYYGARVL
jgi:putative DNA primase/helicase